MADHVHRVDLERFALSLVDGRLGSSQFGAVTNKAAVNTCVQICVDMYLLSCWVNTCEWDATSRDSMTCVIGSGNVLLAAGCVSPPR